MSERQKQYEQLRVTEATNRIYKYRMKKLMPEGENAMVAKDKRAARTRKIRFVTAANFLFEYPTRHYENLPMK